MRWWRSLVIDKDQVFWSRDYKMNNSDGDNDNIYIHHL